MRNDLKNLNNFVNAKNNRRFGGVDLWRAWLVVLGVAVHASSHVQDWTGVFAVVSQKFRMEAFFSLAGFVGSISQSKQSPHGWLKRRLTSLVIPLVFGIFVVNQISSFLILFKPVSLLNKIDILPLYHLWFLVVLIGCSAVQPLIMKISIDDYLCRRGAKYWLVPVIIFVLFLLMQIDPLFGSISNEVSHRSRFIGRLLSDFALTGARIPFYLIFYQIGAGFARGEKWVRLCAGNGVLLWTLVVGGAALTVILCLRSGSMLDPYLAASYGPVDTLVNDFAKSMVALGASLLILQSMTRPKMVGPLTKRLAEASYTIYIVHILFLGIIALPVTYIGIGGLMRFLISFGGALGLSYMTHVYVVERTKWGALLINGRVGWYGARGASAPR